jgi:hypothetical protein
MRRALLALVLAPLLVSSIFGFTGSDAVMGLLAALIVLQVMLAVSFAFALPLLLLLRRIKRLDWWIAFLAGGFCGMCFVAVDTLLSVSPDIDELVNSENVFFVVLGAFTGLVFWWIGIFRNRAFPFVGRRFPISVLVVLPLAAAGAYVQHSLEPVFYQGRVIAILAPPSANPRAGQASVRLTGGGVVRADLGDTWPASRVLGHCVHLERRWSTLRVRRVYEVDVPFGGGIDEC